MPKQKNQQKIMSPVTKKYRETLRSLSDLLVNIQKPIRLLDSIKWDESIQDYFFRHKFKKLPPITHEYYQKIKLFFDPQDKMTELFDLEREVKRRLGEYNPVGE